MTFPSPVLARLLERTAGAPPFAWETCGTTSGHASALLSAGAMLRNLTLWGPGVGAKITRRSVDLFGRIYCELAAL